MSHPVGNRFRIRRDAGRGKRAVVLEAFDTLLQRPVALKTPLAGADPAEIIEEAQRVARVGNPHVISVHDIVTQGERALVLEWLSGRTLRQAMQATAPVDFDTLSRWIQQLLKALAACHRVDVLHGDLKPENLWVDTQDDIKLFDFGTTPRPGGDATALYAAPEVLEGRDHSVSSDLYCVGTIAFELLTQQLPFDGTDTKALVRRKLRQRAPRINNTGGSVDEAIEDWVARSLERRVSDRFQSAEEALESWQRACGSQQDRSRNDLTPGVAHPEALQALREEFPLAGGFSGRVVTVSGAGGVGKTCLLQQLGSDRDARSPRITVRGTVHHTASLQSWAEATDGDEWTQAPESINDVMHRLEARLHGGAPVQELLVVVDDFGRCDVETRRLLIRMAQRAMHLRLGIVSSTNEVELGDSRQDWCTLQDTCSRCLRLDAVGIQDLRRFLQGGQTDNPLPDALIEYVHTLSGGNPRYATHLLEDLEEHGDLLLRDHSWRFQAPAEDRLPTRSSNSMQRAVETLASGERELLEAASLHGTCFDVGTLAHGLAQVPSDVEQRLLDLSRRSDLVMQRTADTFAFRVPLLQRYLEEGIAASRRRSVHEQISDHLLSRPGTDPAALGRHLFHAGRLQEARTHLRAAAQESWRRHELEPARRLLHLALRTFETEPVDESEAALLADLLLQQAATLAELASWEAAFGMIDRCRLLSQAWGLTAQEVQAIRAHGRIEYKQGRFEAAVATLREAQSAATRSADAVQAHELMMQIGNIDFERGRLDAALEGYMTALLFATEQDNTDLEARASNNVALVHSTMGDKAEAIRMFNRSLQLFRKLEREDAVARTEHNIGMTYLDLGNWREARNHFRRSVEISSRIGLDEMLAVSRLELAETNLRLGRIDDAAPDITRALTLCRQRNDPLGTATAYRLQGMMAALQGDLGSAEEHLESSIALLRDLGETPHLGLALLERGRVHLEAGDPDAARPALDEARQIFESLEAPHEALEEVQTLWERCLRRNT